MNSFHFSALKENTGQKNHKNKINLQDLVSWGDIFSYNLKKNVYKEYVILDEYD